MMTCVLEFDEVAIQDQLVAKARAALVVAAEYCLEKAMEHCPVDTGHLRDSGYVMPSGDPDTVWVVFAAIYAPFVEFGHYTRGQTSWVTPIPFLRYGVSDTAIHWPELVTEVWASTVDKGDGTHYYANRFAYSRPTFEAQYTDLGFPKPGRSE